MADFFEVHPAENIHELNGGYRFWYSVFAMVRYDEVWTLVHSRTGDPLMHRDDREHELVMIWPSLGTAEAFAGVEAKEYNPQPVSLQRFLDEALVEFTRMHLRIALCSSANEPFVSCPADGFAKYVELARGLLQMCDSLGDACRFNEEDVCSCTSCNTANQLNESEPRLSFVLRCVGASTLWTVSRDWLWICESDEHDRRVFMLWSSKKQAEGYVTHLKANGVEGNLAVTGIPLMDWLYFWTGWLARSEYRLHLNMFTSSEMMESHNLAPLVFDRMLRATFTRVSGREFPKCY